MTTYTMVLRGALLAFNSTPIKIPDYEEVKKLILNLPPSTPWGDIWDLAEEYTGRLEDYNYFGLVWENPRGYKRVINKEKLQETKGDHKWIFDEKAASVCTLSTAINFSSAIRLGFTINPDSEPVSKLLLGNYQLRRKTENNINPASIEMTITSFLVYYSVFHYNLDI